MTIRAQSDDLAGPPFGSLSGTRAGGDIPLEEWIDRLRLIPDASREFVVGPRQAKLEFGFDAALLADFVAHELPHRIEDDGPLFARHDLHYIGLRLGCAKSYTGALRTWQASLESSNLDRVAEVKLVTYVPPGTTVDVLIERGPRVQAEVGADQTVSTIRATLSPREWPAAPEALTDVLATIAALDFCWVPKSLGKDVNFTRRTGLSDCAASAYLLAAECARLGVPARTAYGLLLASPFSISHSWVEVQTGGAWLPLDPLLLGLLARHATLDAAVWPATRSPGACLFPLAVQETPIGVVDDEPVQMSFPTKFLEGETYMRVRRDARPD